ncbi:hypothetical protein HELRODRAFT_157218 [Helobdella robusta]|uniref:galactosylceramidase n=1 Tax=Helobdella robusta TaxID=6412 RepID=T1EM85_HELRO|nr:hypothetical protein HELRODRAFT_157218 [Helobdella robusta]ESO01741.1 hypothetical protein HELRODRAFT_157218 [Helobdella robusta]
MSFQLFAWCMSFFLLLCQNVHGYYNISVSGGYGRSFDGIGAISGGGATSKLLVNYPPKQRDEILDYLFKPNFAASLHILKVEIGGDAQSTERDGTESSHMHESWDENYERGYEWWLMVEAKKRNPSIKIACLPWAFPGWVGEGKPDPYNRPNTTAMYVVKWILGAKKYYNIDVDYVGIWNERRYTTEYVKVLKQLLLANNLKNVKMVVADGDWSVSADIMKDPAFAAVVDVIGAHYPGTESTEDSQKTNKTLWASEDYSTFNDDVGAGCWARLLNRNYVKGLMTSTIAWNLVASYYDALPYTRDGLMTANEPWSGYYEVANPIWVTAHTTQFTKIGWRYLKHESGVGHLERGGTYVTLISPDNKDITIIIETMTYNHSKCIRPRIPKYEVFSQQAEFFFSGILSGVTKLNRWKSSFKYGLGEKSSVFVKMEPIKVSLSSFRLSLEPDEVYTLTTLEVGVKGQYGSPPPSQKFPLPYSDSYTNYPHYSEAFNFVPQCGVWEVRPAYDDPKNKVNRQVIITKRDVAVSVKMLIPRSNGTTGAFVGSRIDRGGCEALTAKGVFFTIFPADSSYAVYCRLDRTCKITTGVLKDPLKFDTWYTLKIDTKNSVSSLYIDNKLLITVSLPGTIPKNGFVGYGTTNFGIADFDDLSVM